MTANGQDVAQLQIELAEVIGADIGYLSAGDERRHFDLPKSLVTYGTMLFILFLTAAGGRLREHLESSVKKGGVKVADAIWNRLKKVVALGTSKESDTAKKLQLAAGSVEGLSADLTQDQIDVFLAAGRKAVTAQLLQDHFPAEIAEEKANRMARVVTARLSR